MFTVTSETLSSEDCLETKIQARFDKSDQILEHTEEELMDFMEQKHQESIYIKEELVPLNPKIQCLSEVTEVINEISVKITSQVLISKITTSFDEILIRLV